MGLLFTVRKGEWIKMHLAYLYLTRNVSIVSLSTSACHYLHFPYHRSLKTLNPNHWNIDSSSEGNIWSLKSLSSIMEKSCKMESPINRDITPYQILQTLSESQRQGVEGGHYTASLLFHDASCWQSTDLFTLFYFHKSSLFSIDIQNISLPPSTPDAKSK